MTEFPPIPGIPGTEDEEIVRRVANFILQETSFRLRDVVDGRVYDASIGLVPSETIVVDSRFNAWSNRSAMVLEGMTRLGRVLKERCYVDFAPRCLEFSARHLPYFQKLHDLGLKPPRSGQAPGGGMGLYFEWNEMWMTGLAARWIEKADAGQASVHSDYAQRFAESLDRWDRLDEGLLVDGGSFVIACSCFMWFPAMLRLARFENSPSRADDAVQQVLGYHHHLFQNEDELYFRVWDGATNEFQTTYWGRAGGWMAMTLVDFLAEMKADAPRYPELLAAYAAQMHGLRRWQADTGGWRQVMDHAESWVETSCTGMFTYALARGVNEGWLGPSYKADALAGWKALRDKVTESGQLADTCPATVPGDLSHYLARPRTMDDPHAYGPFLLAGAEILRLQAGMGDTGSSDSGVCA